MGQHILAFSVLGTNILILKGISLAKMTEKINQEERYRGLGLKKGLFEVGN